MAALRGQRRDKMSDSMGHNLFKGLRAYSQSQFASQYNTYATRNRYNNEQVGQVIDAYNYVNQ